MGASALKAAVKQVALNLFPDLALKLLSIRSRRLSERVVRDLGLDTLAVLPPASAGPNACRSQSL
jgi:hypothetical protein